MIHGVIIFEVCVYALTHPYTIQDVTFVVIQYRQWSAFFGRFPVPYLVRKTNTITYIPYSHERMSTFKRVFTPTFGLTSCIGSKSTMG